MWYDVEKRKRCLVDLNKILSSNYTTPTESKTLRTRVSLECLSSRSLSLITTCFITHTVISLCMGEVKMYLL